MPTRTSPFCRPKKATLKRTQPSSGGSHPGQKFPPWKRRWFCEQVPRWRKVTPCTLSIWMLSECGACTHVGHWWSHLVTRLGTEAVWAHNCKLMHALNWRFRYNEMFKKWMTKTKVSTFFVWYLGKKRERVKKAKMARADCGSWRSLLKLKGSSWEAGMWTKREVKRGTVMVRNMKTT